MILNEDIQFTGGNRYEIERESQTRSPSPFQIKTKPTDKNKRFIKNKSPFGGVENKAEDDFLFAPKDWEE